MTDQLIARRYASALYLVCLEKGILNQVEKELIYFSTTVKLNKDLYRLLTSPRISFEKKKELLKIIFTDSLSQVTFNLIFLLIDKKRETILPEISDIFSHIILENSNIVVARITTAFPLSSVEQEEIKTSISILTGKTVKMEIDLDPSIIGGLIVRVEDKVYDGSLTGHLKRLEQDMAGIS